MPNGIELRYCGTSRHRFDWWWSEIEGRWLEETEVAELFRELEARVAELEAGLRSLGFTGREDPLPCYCQVGDRLHSPLCQKTRNLLAKP